jgi:hypothetical protein
MTLIRDRQPELSVSLDQQSEVILKQDLETLIKNQTDAILKS